MMENEGMQRLEQAAIVGPKADGAPTAGGPLAAGLEWWLGNGLGGWSSGTAAGMMSRKYHALFAVSHPSVEERLILLGKLEETALAGHERIALSSNYYPGAVHPDGWRRIERFLFDGAAARWTYRVAERRLAKEVWCERQANATYIRYSLLEGEPLGLEAVPLVSGRAAHGIGLPPFMRQTPGGFCSEKGVRWGEPLAWGLTADTGLFRPKADLYYHMQYPLEEERGEACEEDWAVPGRFEFMLREGHQATLTAWAGEEQAPGRNEAWNRGAGRADTRAGRMGESTGAVGPGGLGTGSMHLSPPDPEDPSRHLAHVVAEFRAYNKWGEGSGLEGLVRASESFFIKDGRHYNIVAGYPYFGRWARDALISVPGLCVYTGRHGLARDVIEGWMGWLQKGLLPNRFDSRNQPVYESADGTLWLFWAISELEREGGLNLPLMTRWWPALSAALRAWISDNKFVRLDGDGLVVLREERLTWMDAARKNDSNMEPITPRAGKRVEINALWIHALSCAERWAHWMEDRPSIRLFGEAAHLARSNFNKFYNEYANFLDDGIEPTDGHLRPNQLWAIALPSVGLSPVQARRSLGAMSQALWLPGAGVRTLAPSDNDYHAHLIGNRVERDEAYHQGAVWPWLSGVWVEAWLRTYPQRAEELHRQMKAVVAARETGALLSVAEIRDPTSGQNDGAPSQAPLSHLLS